MEMHKSLNRINENFHSPFSLLFFLTGLGFLLLGISLQLDWLPWPQPSDAPRFIIGIGLLCFGLSTYIYYHPALLPCSLQHSSDRFGMPRDLLGLSELPKGLAPELKLSLCERRSYITERQRQVLRFIERFEPVSFDQICIEFTASMGRDLFYRLEQLRLLGLIVCDFQPAEDRAQTQTAVYRLSEDYQRELQEHLPQ